jgi:hypothetical protein
VVQQCGAGGSSAGRPGSVMKALNVSAAGRAVQLLELRQIGPGGSHSR